MGGIISKKIINIIPEARGDRWDKEVTYIKRVEEMDPEEKVDYEEDLEREAVIHRMKTAVDHAVSFYYADAPVKVQKMHYPPTSKKAGQPYMWIMVDDVALKQRGTDELDTKKMKYPAGVAVDTNGNMYVSNPTRARYQQARRISIGSILTIADTTCTPPSPTIPILVEATQHTLIIEWKMPCKAVVEHYEVQYRRGECEKAISHSLAPDLHLTRKKVRQATLENIPYHADFSFRVCAFNHIGQGVYSDWSAVYWTLPGPPETPSAPFPILLSNTFIGMVWTRTCENGSPLRHYMLQMRECDYPTTTTMRTHSDAVVGSTSIKTNTTMSETPRGGYAMLYVGTEQGYTVSALRPQTCYRFRLCATNEIGTSEWVETAAIRTAQFVTPVVLELPAAVQSNAAATCERWVTCWDPVREQIFYFNK